MHVHDQIFLGFDVITLLLTVTRKCMGSGDEIDVALLGLIIGVSQFVKVINILLI